MKEVPNILAFARTLVVHFGSDAVGIAEGHVEMHRRAKESNDSELWQCVADADLRSFIKCGLVIAKGVIQSAARSSRPNSSSV